MSQLDQSIERVLAVRTSAYLMATAALLILSAPIFTHHKTASVSQAHLTSSVTAKHTANKKQFLKTAALP